MFGLYGWRESGSKRTVYDNTRAFETGEQQRIEGENDVSLHDVEVVNARHNIPILGVLALQLDS